MPAKKSKSVIASFSGAPNPALSSGISGDASLPPLEVFMDISASQLGSAQPANDIGRLVFRLSRETHPKTCENFRLLTLGTVIPADKKQGKDQKVFSYLGTTFSRITEDGVQGGNIHRVFDPSNVGAQATHSNSISMSTRTQPPPIPESRGGPRSNSPSAGAASSAANAKNAIPESMLQSIYGPVFSDEAKGALPVGYGTLMMCNSGPNTNGSQFFICTRKPHSTNFEETQQAVEHLQKHYVVFGGLVEGSEVLEMLASGMSRFVNDDSGDVRGAPFVYYIASCGVFGTDSNAAGYSSSPAGKK